MKADAEAFRSELIRLWRPSFLLGGIGVMAGFAALVSIFIFTSAKTALVPSRPSWDKALDRSPSPRSPVLAASSLPSGR